MLSAETQIVELATVCVVLVIALVAVSVVAYICIKKIDDRLERLETGSLKSRAAPECSHTELEVLFVDLSDNEETMMLRCKRCPSQFRVHRVIKQLEI